MQVCSLPRHVIKLGQTASRLLDAQAPDTEAARRRDAVRRWRDAIGAGLTAEAAAHAVGVARATLYRWEKQPAPRSRRPKRSRPRQWTAPLVQAVEDLRNDNPVWGKRKLGPLLRGAGFNVSDSTVGRILAELRRRGRIIAVAAFQSAKPLRKAAKRAWARRLRGALKADVPGGAVQIDTLSLRLQDKTVKHFSAIDRLSRWAAGMAASRATASAAARFLEKLIRTAPFPIKAIQIDGGSEFMAEFEDACRKHEIQLWVLPPRSPELNGRVERMQATWRREFYEVYDPPHQIDQLNPLIDAYAHRYNDLRPHDALGGKTPNHYLQTRAA